MNFKTLIDVLRETITRWQQDKVTRLAAALAFYTMFSLAPLIILVIAIAGALFGQEAAQGRLVAEIQGLVGVQGAEIIETMIQNASAPTSGGPIATVISLVTLFLGASGVFLQLQDALNTIWGVMPNPKAGLSVLIRSRAVAFALVLAVGFLLLVSLVVSAGLAGFSDLLNNQFPGGGVVLQIVNQVITLAVFTLAFATLYKYLPDVKISWTDVMVGAFVTALLFTIGKFAIGLYLGNSTVASVYGAAGSLVVLLIWIFYTSQLVFFGAEFTQVYATRFGKMIEPDNNAVAITHEARARQGIPAKEDVEAAADLQEARRER